VEHYEMTRYGTLVTWAQEAGREDCARLLRETLEEERAADKKLTMIAEREVNLKAA
jgi:ferritin-like metal-binding protein YciE